MKAALVDTNILSLFFRGHPRVVAKFQAYLAEYDTISLSIITYYEIVSGLKHRDAQVQLDSFWLSVRKTRYCRLLKKRRTLPQICMLVCERRGSPSMKLIC